MNTVPRKRNQQFMHDPNQLQTLRLKNLNSNQELIYTKQENSHAKIIKYQVIWYAATLLIYGWFLGWIAYEIFVWQKPITAVSITNYIGAITAMALIWGGNVIFTIPSKSVLQLDKEKIFQEKTLKKKSSKKRLQREPSKKRRRQKIAPPIEYASLVQPEPAQTQFEPKPKKVTKIQLQDAPVSLLELNRTSTDLGCSHHIKNSLEIPSKCLTCKELVKCLSKPKK